MSKHIHMVGIGGIGMSALAQVLQKRRQILGWKITGSDLHESEIIEDLRASGINVTIGHKAENAQDADEIIYSEAISKENPERTLGIPEMTYFEALGKLTSLFPNAEVYAIAGTHGKSTTVAMLAKCLINSRKSVNVIVGTKMKDFNNTNYYLASDPKKYLIEACEYRRNFLPLKPSLLGITNMEFDHPDYFKDEADYFHAFNELKAQSEVTIEKYEKYEGELGVPGEHNRENAGLAFAMAMHIDPSKEKEYRKALKEFKGAWRRFDRVGVFNGADIILDYAHHPTEIKTTLKTAREAYPKKRILAVFQAHQHSRVIEFIEEFKDSFQSADKLFITDIYSCRDSEEDMQRMSTEDFVKELQKKHKEVEQSGGIETTARRLKEVAEEGDLILVMGAGSIDQITKWLVED